MKCSTWVNGALYALALLVCVTFLRCDESLPEYIAPENVLAVRISTVEPLSDRVAKPGREMMHIRLEGQNVYDEVFQDVVNLRGTMRIWWTRKPHRYRTITLTEKNLTDRSLIQNGRLTLLPQQKFFMDVFWNLRGDDSVYFPREMTYTNQDFCAHNLLCSTPEEFTIESSLTVFDRLGVVLAPPREFVFIAHACYETNYPPCTGD